MASLTTTTTTTRRRRRRRKKKKTTSGFSYYLVAAAAMLVSLSPLSSTSRRTSSVVVVAAAASAAFVGKPAAGTAKSLTTTGIVTAMAKLTPTALQLSPSDRSDDGDDGEEEMDGNSRAVENSGFDADGFRDYLLPYAAGLLASAVATALFVQFVLLQ